MLAYKAQNLDPKNRLETLTVNQLPIHGATQDSSGNSLQRHYKHAKQPHPRVMYDDTVYKMRIAVGRRVDDMTPTAVQLHILMHMSWAIQIPPPLRHPLKVPLNSP